MTLSTLILILNLASGVNYIKERPEEAVDDKLFALQLRGLFFMTPQLGSVEASGGGTIISDLLLSGGGSLAFDVRPSKYFSAGFDIGLTDFLTDSSSPDVLELMLWPYLRLLVELDKAESLAIFFRLAIGYSLFIASSRETLQTTDPSTISGWGLSLGGGLEYRFESLVKVPLGLIFEFGYLLSSYEGQFQQSGGTSVQKTNLNSLFLQLGIIWYF